MDSRQLEFGQRDLDRMLLTLHRAGYVRLEPEPPEKDEPPPPAPRAPPKKAALVIAWEPATAAETAPPQAPAYRPRRPIPRRKWPS